MADVTLTRVALTEVGPELGANDTALTTGNTYYYDNKDGAPLIYLNFTGSATVTIETTFQAAGESLPDKTIAGTVGQIYVLKPRLPKYYNQADGTVKITTSANNVTAAILVP